MNTKGRRIVAIFRRGSALLGSILLLLGILTLLTAGALYAYGTYERYRFEQDLPGLMAELEPPTTEPATTPSAEALSPTPEEAREGQRSPEPVLEAVAEAEPSPTPTSTTTPVPTPKPFIKMPPTTRIVIPKIRVDSRVVEAKVINGEWQVPRFLVGHLEGTANPGEDSNVALSGHIESINAGNVFARLEELGPGDEVTLFAGDREFVYQITETLVVANDDLSVVAPTPSETLTLITCTGIWNPFTRDYDKRFIAIGEPVEPEPPDP
ncbi:MAG: sortase [Chloroflexi bacterium]|nr:sortase [Chloroflexota bacterium]